MPLTPVLSRNQQYRKHTVQYISYPYDKFDMLRKSDPGKYEGSAPIALNEWIKTRIEVNGDFAEMFINDTKYSTFVVDRMLGTSKIGGVGLYVDIGTSGYFKDLKVTKRAYDPNKNVTTKVDDI